MTNLSTALVLAILAACVPALAEGRASMESTLTAKKQPSAVQLQLLRADQLCGAVVDCAATDPYRGLRALNDPCLLNVVGCHMAVSLGAHREDRSWNIGGAKLSTAVGPVTVTVGRHRKNIVLSKVPFVEGTYQLGRDASLGFGILRSRSGPKPHNVVYVSFRMPLW